ncbi:LysE family translocator [Oceanibacterium hippocampi]|uniref:Homoserine/homoserine lactone efflux protein n=1 Tax=Oceanibacterium hippocampi TaxID=745714 RepID=A0A1Y5RAU4_9PROT|nr:LysE family transporter [Oceanibacterium hippocampi]SLN10591.1 Homoserine/homoserine lactone efflux protein [Oceanibacterium hippocampi]
MSIESWLIYLLAAVGLSLTPGPNGLLALTHGASFGLRPTVHTVLGGALGFLLLIAASLAGMGALLAASEEAFTVAKWIGAGYLIYLGARLWRAPAISVSDAPGGARPHGRSSARRFNQGFIVAVSNPKGLIFFAAFLPQFMVPGTSFLTQMIVFGGTFVLIEVIYELLLAGLAQRIAPWLARYGRWFNRVTGGAFIGIGAALTMATR